MIFFFLHKLTQFSEVSMKGFVTRFDSKILKSCSLTAPFSGRPCSNVCWFQGAESATGLRPPSPAHHVSTNCITFYPFDHAGHF